MATTNAKSVLNATNNAELLSYIINVDPILSAEIELPVQGENPAEIGKVILSNERHRNAFINTVNMIGLTVIQRTMFTNPWNFTDKGMINSGESVREIVINLVESHDYNLNKDNVLSFLDNEVPNIMSYIHEINFQKYYKTTTSDEEMSMAFDSETGLFDLIDKIVGKLYESLEEDIYLLNKYQLCRRIVDGTTGVEYIPANFTTRQIIAKMKAISNNMEFISGDYNPAGYEHSVNKNNQMNIFDTDFEGSLTAEVLATSYFKNEADMETRKKLINKFTFSPSEEKRLLNLLNKELSEEVFTDDEKAQLSKVKSVIMEDSFFQDYKVALGLDGVGNKKTTFENPETLRTNHWLHAWRIFSTSPYANIVAITTGDEPEITSVTAKINGSEVSETVSITNITSGELVLDTEISVNGNNIYNKAYLVEIDDETGKVRFENGKFVIKGSNAGGDFDVTITSIGDKSKKLEFTISL